MRISRIPAQRQSWTAAMIALLLTASTCDTTQSQNPDGITAITNVNVVDVANGAIVPNSTVVIDGDRIIEVGASVNVPDGVTLVDGTDKFLIPGLAEMHGHIPNPSTNSQEDIDETLFLYVANGITTVRGMLGWNGQLDLRERAARNEMVSPMLYLAGPSFNGTSVSSPEQAVGMVERQVAEGWDLLKIHPGLTLAEFNAVADKANELGIRFGGHVPAEVGLAHALAKGQETFDHIDGYNIAVDGTEGPLDETKLAQFVEATKEAGALAVPTMVLWEALYGLPSVDEAMGYAELQYVSNNTRESWRSRLERTKNNPGYDRLTAEIVIDNRMRILKALSDAGAGILMGTDSPQLFSVPGFSLHREVQTMARAGMSPLQVLQSGTIAVGEYFSESDTFGQVAQGHRADLVLLNANPLESVDNLQSIQGVVLRGKWLSKDDIDRRLDAIADRHSGTAQ